MKKVIENINLVLAEWNPIGVPVEIAADEYKSYIPLILECINDKQKLAHCLEDILVKEIGVSYDSTNKQHSEELQNVSTKLIEAYNAAKVL